eukprot:GHVR01048822.1.p1 GENE.GHVR01048822.1~~GHVR01048822.1.p1  ORF type:complete len:198 (-),score=42.81 GHVR01048822.1:441-1034(-)
MQGQDYFIKYDPEYAPAYYHCKKSIHNERTTLYNTVGLSDSSTIVLEEDVHPLLDSTSSSEHVDLYDIPHIYIGETMLGSSALAQEEEQPPPPPPPSTPPGGGYCRGDCRIFVSRLPYDAKVRTLRSYFARFGHIVDAYIPRKPTRKSESKGFGFISFASETSVRVVLGTKHVIDGREILVDRADASPQDRKWLSVK